MSICNHPDKKADYFYNSRHHCQACWDKLFADNPDKAKEIIAEVQARRKRIMEVCGYNDNR